MNRNHPHRGNGFEILVQENEVKKGLIREEKWR